jgi:hypothetical protein
MARAQKGAEQLLAAAGLGEPAIAQVVQSIMEANESEIARSGASAPTASTRPAEAVAEPGPDADDEPAAPPVTPTADADEAQEEPAEGGEPEPEN